MTQYVPLDKNLHNNIRIITERGAQYGENVHLVPIVADEINHMVLEYPLCFIKNNDTGQFGLHALLGFEPEQNLFLNGDQWQANYVPLHIQRQPFIVSVNSQTGEQPSPENSVISINTNSARVQDQQGEALFDEQGNNTPFLDKINHMLSSLMNGLNRTEKFINTLTELNLIEAVQLNVSFDNSSSQRFDGIYTVNQQNLNNLTPEQLHQLNQLGYLQACYLLLSSMGNVQKLVKLRQSS